MVIISYRRVIPFAHQNHTEQNSSPDLEVGEKRIVFSALAKIKNEYGLNVQMVLNVVSGFSIYCKSKFFVKSHDI